MHLCVFKRPGRFKKKSSSRCLIILSPLGLIIHAVIKNVVEKNDVNILKRVNIINH